MKRRSRPKSAYQGYQGNRRRHQGLKIFLIVVLILAVLAGGIYFACRQFGWSIPIPQITISFPQTNPDSPDKTAEPNKTPEPEDSGSMADHMTTPSGIPCTLTDLGTDAIYRGDLILVNNQIFYHFPSESQEKDLSVIFDNKTDSYYVRDKDVLLAPHALEALNRLMDAFREQGGSKSVNVVAGFRTEEFQQHLFDQSAERNGLDHAQQFVAQPGGSEHHTGLVVDFSILFPDGSSDEYRGVGEYAWINENCQDYGWVVRYDMNKVNLTGISTEPWHFRYVGTPHATVMVQENLCLEEYIDYLKQFTFDQEHLTVECVDGTYEIWYAEGTKIHVPDSGQYSTSGNNVDGVIVTCKIK